MKTTEQAAIEYADNLKSAYMEEGIEVTEYDHLAAKSNFKAGKAFAEEFISFQDEVPPISKEKILLKREKPNSETIYELRRFTTKK